MVIARIGCRAMPAATVRLPLASFWADNSDVVTAVLSVVLALILPTLLDRYIARRGHNLAAAGTRGGGSPGLHTPPRLFPPPVYPGGPPPRHPGAGPQVTRLSKPAPHHPPPR